MLSPALPLRASPAWRGSPAAGTGSRYATLSDTVELGFDLLELGLQRLLAAREFTQVFLAGLIFPAKCLQLELLLSDPLSKVLKGNGTATHDAAGLHEKMAKKEPTCR